MMLQTRCTWCGRLFDLDRAAIVRGRWRLCPDCQEPPPTGGVLAVNDVVVPQWTKEAA